MIDRHAGLEPDPHRAVFHVRLGLRGDLGPPHSESPAR